MTLLAPILAAALVAQTAPLPVARPPLPQPSRMPPGAPAPVAAPVVAQPPIAAPAVNEAPSTPAPVDFAERARRGRFSFEFAKAEIMDVVKAISDIMRRNFIIPEKLKGQRITILSPTTVTANEAYQVFLAALAANDMSLVRVGKFYKIVESKESIKQPIPTCVGADDDCPRYSEQMITTMLRLNYVDGQQLTGVLKSLISKDGELSLFAPSNALIVSEYAPNIERIKRIIAALDVPGGDDELQIVHIQYATATEIADKLSQIFDIAGRGGAGATGRRRAAATPGTPGVPPKAGEGGGGEEEVQISKIVPDERTNQIIIKANRRSFDAIRRLIGKLDVPISDAEQGRVHVHYLENASAEDLASTLSSLAQGQAGRRAAATRPGGVAPTGAPNVPETADLFEGELKITADKATNSLIVISSGHDFRSLRKIIEMLDTPRRQVYVEAAILEVTVTDSEQFGVNWHVPGRVSKNDPGGQYIGGPDTFGFLQSAQSSGGLSPTLAALSSPTALLGMAGGSVAGIVGKGITIPLGSGGEVTIPSFGIILKWLQTSSNAQILSTPHILTTDNEEASIEVGKKIPFRRGTALPSIGTLPTGTGTGANGLNALSSYGNLFSSVDRIDVALKLTLTPQINEGNKVRLNIEQQLEDVVEVDEATQQPITANRSSKTVVVVDDQQTVVLGGLMRDNTVESESKIPILGDLPLVGWLFRQRSQKTEKVNLLLVLTPYIIRDADDFRRIFQRKLAEHEEFAAEYYGHQREYRAYIDYTHKIGPLAYLHRLLDQDKVKVENGGRGDGSETLVSPPTAPAESTSDAIPVPSDPVDSVPITDPGPAEVPAPTGESSGEPAPPPPQDAPPEE